MEETIITELVKFMPLETTSDEQLLNAADIFNCFHKTQDGFMDSELVKGIQGSECLFIYHYECMEKIKAAGEKMRNSYEFKEFLSLINPGSVSVTLFQHMGKWELVMAGKNKLAGKEDKK